MYTEAKERKVKGYEAGNRWSSGIDKTWLPGVPKGIRQINCLKVAGETFVPTLGASDHCMVYPYRNGFVRLKHFMVENAIS